MKFLVGFNDFITIISFIGNIILLVPFAQNGYEYIVKKRYIKKVLGYSNDVVNISQSKFVFGNFRDNTFVTYSSVQAVSNIIRLLNMGNQKFSLVDKDVDGRNEMHIGGFLVNKKVNAYFVKHFLNFKYIDFYKKEGEYIDSGIDTRFVTFTKEKRGFQIGDTFLDISNEKTDYAFLIKLVDDDFIDDHKRTVHILFGAWSEGTIKASEYILTHYKEIYEKYKEDHYFFVLEINRGDNSINYAKGIMDFTNQMFQS